jgi:hypothetical protein
VGTIELDMARGAGDGHCDVIAAPRTGRHR